MKNSTTVFNPALNKWMNHITCALFVFALSGLSHQLQAQSGKAFRDFNGDGLQTGAEPGVEGIIVKLYGNATPPLADQLIGSTTTTADGSYNFATSLASGRAANPGERLRIEFEIPPSFKCGLANQVDFASVAGEVYGTSVQFITGQQSDVNLALNYPGQWVESNNPDVFLPCYFFGDNVNGDNNIKNAAGLVTYKFLDNGIPISHSDNTGAPNPTMLSTYAEVGALYGVAFSRQAKKIFSSAVMRRHTAFGPLGSGGIYMVDPYAAGSPTYNFLDLDAIGIATRGTGAYPPNPGNNTSPVSTVIGTNVERGLNLTPFTPSTDYAAGDQVGKVSIGDIDISDDGRYLYVVNLLDRKLYEIDLGDALNPTAPTLANVATRVRSWSIPDPGTNPKSGEHRPWGLKFYRGKLYVGLVLSGQDINGNVVSDITLDGDGAQLRGYVYEFSPTGAGTFNTAPLLDFSFDYGRERPWIPWGYSTNPAHPSRYFTGDQREIAEPIIADIEFDDQGSMLIGVLDRKGHQYAINNNDYNGNIVDYEYATAGELLRAQVSETPQGCTYSIVTRFGTADYYNDNLVHDESVQGPLAVLPGGGDAIAVWLDPIRIRSGGTIRLDNTTGERVPNSAYEVTDDRFTTDAGIDFDATPSKANGLGDVELSGEVAPLEIGNRVWADKDGDGIQDGEEKGIAGVMIELYLGNTLVAQTTTNASGNFYFNDSNVTLAGETGLRPNTTYAIRIPATQYNNGGVAGSPLQGMLLTDFKASGAGLVNLSDNDAALNAGLAQITATTADYGENDHSFDFGFIPVDYGDLPAPYHTAIADNGPSHLLGSVLKLGATVDYDDNGIPSTDATGDDTEVSDDDNGDDENGVNLPMFIRNKAADLIISVMNETGSPAKLVGYFDWNGDGDFNDTNEMYTVAVATGAVSATLDDVTPPTTAVLNRPIGIRFRISTDATFAINMSPDGPLPDGEVEDYVASVMAFDFGDLNDALSSTSGDPNVAVPADHRTLSNDNGPSHKLRTNANGDQVILKIGALVDDELDGQPSLTAGLTGGDDNSASAPSGADDEDGITAGNAPSLIISQTTNLVVPVMNMTGEDAKLSVYLDFDKNGDFGAGEMFSTLVPNGATTATVAIVVPLSAVLGQDLGLRMRLADADEPMSPYGQAQSGEVEDYMVRISGLDYGDLPPNYPTLLADNGPRHVVVPNPPVYLGTTVDLESDGQPDADAGELDGGDDSSEDDDEDGVTEPAMIFQGETVVFQLSVVNKSASTAYVYGYIDWNNDDDFNDAEEIQFGTVAANTNTLLSLTFNVPINATINTDLGARFRIGTVQDQIDQATGLATDGEVEDYLVRVKGLDYGDLPPTYVTLETNNGPRHGVSETPTVYLGTQPDVEANGQPDADAGEINGGDGADEDGITEPVMIFQGETARFSVNVTTNTTAYVYGYIDWNNDKDFNDAEEIQWASTGSSGVVTLNFNVPLNAVINTDLGARFRIGTIQDQVDQATGFAMDGEVEDYLVKVKGLDWGDLPPSYATIDTQDGPRHGVSETPTVYLGASVDTDADGQPDSDAGEINGGDDGDESDDENGVIEPAMIFQGETAAFTVNVTTNTTAYVYGYIDWNNDDDFNDANEVQWTTATSTGPVTLTFNVPLNTVINTDLGARFRVGTVQDQVDQATGFAMDGEVEDYLVRVKGLDYGDLADTQPGVSTGDYQTIYANNGPRHAVAETPAIYLGASVDVDTDGQPDLGAGEDGTNGDDNDSDGDDENGVTKPVMIFQGENAEFTLNVTTNTNVFIYGYIDWNNDGDFNDAGEVQSTSTASTGPVPLTFAVPINAVAGTPLGARFRIGSVEAQVNTPLGFAMDGEVEDYLVTVKALDYGDLPAPYLTLEAADGPRHAVAPTPELYLGTVVDIDPDGQPDADAGETDGGDDGDSTGGDDEDGVIEPAMLFQGETAAFQVAVVNKTASTAYVYGYIDWNKDGDFADAEEVQSTTVAANTSATVTLTFNVPLNATINTNLGARFRVGTVQDEVDQATGFAMNGEVEDYLVRVKGLDYGDLPPTYVTLETNDGPRHGVSENPSVYLGTQPDVEADGQPDADAGETGNGDGADENGIVEPAMIFQGEEAKFIVNVVTNTTAYVYGYIDWNKDGDFSDADEVQFATVAATGPVVLTFNVPLNAVINSDLGARFRIGTVQDQVDSPIGFAMDGEVEDYEVRVKGLDYGDLPANYATLETNDGPRHGIAETPTTYLGAGVDVEPNGQPDSDAGEVDGGDGADENGVIEPAMIFQGEQTSFTVNVTTNTTAYVYGYIDWNGDKDFNDANEVQWKSVASSGPVTLTFNVPLNAVINSDLGARFRIGTVQDQVDQATGFAMDGEVEDYLIQVKGLDYGDLPDLQAGVSTGDYQTLYTNNGPRHAIAETPTIYLGASVDVDTDGQPDLGAGEDGTNGDDNDTDGDDENGVTKPVMIFQGENAAFTVNVTTNTNGFVYGYIDWNNDGDFNDAGEVQSTSTAVTGPVTLTFAVPINAVAGVNLGARFRVGSIEAQVNTPLGFAMDGEVEDYLVTVKALDYGDLPAPYLTLEAADGPRHAVAPTPELYLGTVVDIDPDGQPDADAGETDGGDDGDSTGGDDEDGVIEPAMLFQGETAAFQVALVNKTASPAFVYGYIDWNDDGDFTDAEEVQFTTVAANTSATITLTFNVPLGATINNDLGARFRVGTIQNEVDQATGFAMNGEVEDYLVRVKGLDYGDLPPTYVTLETNDGPRHGVSENPTVYLGTQPDVEADGQPDADAGETGNGDGADENGVVEPAMIFQGEEAKFTVNVVTNTTAYVYGYIDWNNDKDFNDAEEIQWTSVTATGAVVLTFNVPLNAVINSDLGARFRIGTVQDQVDSPIGFAMDGEVEDYEVRVKGLDYGDLPASYATLEANDGPRHGIAETPRTYLGAGVDVEPNGQPDSDAGEVDGGDGVDENGVIEPAMIFQGEQASFTVNVTTNTTAYVYGYIDWNNDDDFNDAGEVQWTTTSSTGPVTLTFNVPLNAVINTDLGARFRVGTVQDQVDQATGFAMDGEVEDYLVRVKGLDYGDLPDLQAGVSTGDYQTLYTNNGPRHAVAETPTIYLGASVDVDTDGQPDLGAGEDGTNGDDNDTDGDDENGVTKPVMIFQGENAAFTVNVTTNTNVFVYGYIDWNNDGKFDGPGEVQSTTTATTGPVTLTFNVPLNAVAGVNLGARFRVGSIEAQVNTPLGFAMDGEVEDYLVTVKALDYGDLPAPYLTLEAADGPRHAIAPIPELYLGTVVDIDPDGQPDADAGETDGGDDGDSTSGDDEDGVIEPAMLFQGETAAFQVAVVNKTASLAYVYGYIDWNKDGDFADADEVQTTTVAANTSATVTLTFNVPLNATINSDLGARFRVGTIQDEVDQATGFAMNGEVEDYLVRVKGLDYGDLPSPIYATTETNDGPRHGVSEDPKVYLGTKPDVEPDGQPNGTATGDGADEDGVTPPAMLFQGETASFTVNVTTNTTAYLYGYIDWNKDGLFTGPEEVQWTSVTASGPVTLTFNVPLGAVINSDLGARFRLGTVQDQVDQATGFAMDGEVEDYLVRVKGLDYGDLPASYATLEANDGPRHGIAETPTTYLGAGVDLEADGQPDADAGEINGGDGADENGVIEPAMIFQGEQASFTVNVTTNSTAYVYGYIDWNNDDDFNDAGEVQWTTTSTTGPVTLTFNVPLNAVINSDLGARFRIGTVQDQVDQATGFAMDGEVEDYLIQVKGLDYGDLPDFFANVSTGDYQTNYANNGPRHAVPATPKLFLGTVVDVDADGQPDLGAGEDGTGGDDNDGDASDDEDGVVGPPMIFRGEEASFAVTLNLTNLTGTTAYVYGYIDWNGNGILGDTPQEIASASSTVSGPITLTFDVPLGAVANSNLGARFRVGSVQNQVNVPNGFAMDGEVEDYLVRVKGLDFGDLPQPYATLDSQDGPRHAVSETPQVYLGSTIDIDDDGQPDADAGELDGGDDGDATGGDDEDGVIEPAMLFRGEAATFRVAVVNNSANTAYVYGYIDWNKDGDFADADEVQFASVAANSSTSVNLTFNVPLNAVINSDLGARFRVGTVQNEVDQATGFAMNGEVEDYLVRVKGLDYGDLPPSYATTDNNDGPRHAQSENPQLYFGGKPDVELDGQPDPNAGETGNGDGVDEDGIVEPAMLFRGEEARFKVNVTNTSGQTAFIYGYIDWNNDDKFDGPGELASATLAGSGMIELVYQVPQNAVINTDLGVRFRIGTVQDQVDQATGFAMDGEVEDYLIQVKGLDFGDAGETFPTTDAQDGARHGVPTTPTLYFGSTVDVELDGQPDDDAGETGGGDDGNGDDEDGVSMLDANGNPTMLITCLETTMRINTVIPVGQTAYLQGWIDFNDDGDWADAGEQVAKDIALTSVNGTYYLTFKVPCDAKVTPRTFLRFRLSTTPGLSYTGFAMDGEVEDYVEVLKGLDFGDLPTKENTALFPTTLADNGPHHVYDPTAPALTLGSNLDADLDGTPSAFADGDDKADGSDDEDGITFLTPLFPGQQACIEIDAVNNTGQTTYLYAYMDYDGDCVLAPLFNIPVPAGGLNNYRYCFTVPSDNSTSGAMAFFRFRLGTNANEVNIPTGLAMNGEVEDYKVSLYKVGNLVWEDRNNNGLQDNTEKDLGINGIPVALVYAGANGTIETDLSTLPSSGGVGAGDDYVLYTTTASVTFGDGVVTKGIYYFCGLIEGKYDIVFFDPKSGTPTLPNNISQSVDEDKDSDGLGITVPANTPKRSHTGLFMLSGDLVKTEAGIGDQDLSKAPNTNDVLGYPDNRVDQRYDQGYIFLDYGDLPQETELATAHYNTTNAENGPRHLVKPDFYLGASIDAETDGQPDDQAGSGAYGPSEGDDAANNDPAAWKYGVCNDDEDGIKFLTPLIPGYEACIELKYVLPDNFNGPDGYLNAWIDYNGNGTLDAGEKLAWTKINGAIAPIEPTTGALELDKIYMINGGGKVIVCFKVPADAAYFAGNIFSRFRLSENPRLSPDGILPAESGYPNGKIPCGEVEDYFMKLSKVGNLVWEDHNYNGLQDAGERPIAGVPMKLEYAGLDGVFGSANKATDLEYTYLDTTDASGRYYFCGLIGDNDYDPSGVDTAVYKLTAQDPAGMTPTVDLNSAAVCEKTDANGNDTTIDDKVTSEVFAIDNPMGLCKNELHPVGINDQGTVGTFPDMQVDETHDFAYVGFDYGDLPVAGTNYLTLRDSLSAQFSGKFGPRHVIQPKLYLGEGVDGELNGQPDADAGSKNGGDDDGQGLFGKGSFADDETGVRLLSPMIPGELAYLKVTYTSQDTVLAGGYANKDAYLRSFIDFNGDGDLNDADDLLSFTAMGTSMSTLANITTTDNPILPGGVNQMRVLAFRVPLTATYRDGTAFIRHRLSWEANLGPDNNTFHQNTAPYVNTALAYPRGEVEDYAVPVAKVGNLSWFDHDVKGDQNENDFVKDLQLVLIWGGIDETSGKFDTVGYQSTMGSAGSVTDVLYNLSIVPNGAATMPPASNDTPGQIVKTTAQGLYSFQGLIPGNYYLVPLKYLQPDSASFVNAYPKHRVLTLKDNLGADDQNDSDGMPGALIRINDGNGREPEVCVSPQPKGERGKLDSLDATNMNAMSSHPFPDSLYNQTIDFGWVDEPNIEANLDIVGVYFPTSQICGNFNVIMHMCVKNPQEVPLDSLQAFLNLKDAYGDALYTATKPVVSIADSAYIKGPAYGKFRKSQLGAKTQLVPNPNYDGVTDTRLLVPTSEDANFVLKGDSVVCIRIEFEIDPTKTANYPWMSQGSVTTRAVGLTPTGSKRPLTDYFVKSPRFGKHIVVSDLTDEIDDPTLEGDRVAFEGTAADRDYTNAETDKYLDENDKTVQNDECWIKTQWVSGQHDVKVALNSKCEAIINAEIFVPNFDPACGFDKYTEGSYYAVIIQDKWTLETVWTSDDPRPFDARNYWGRNLIYKVKSVANHCYPIWGEFILEDKIAPVVKCAPDTDRKVVGSTPSGTYTFVCTDIDSILNVKKSWTNPNYAYYTGIAVANDSCGNTWLDNVSDVLEVLADCEQSANAGFVYARIKRSFIFTDEKGNQTTCVQIINFRRPRIVLPECKVEVPNNLASASANLLPADLIKAPFNLAESVPYFFNGAGKRIYLTGRDYCNLAVNYTDETVFTVVQCGRKIVRRWTLFDWCYGQKGNQTAYPVYHIIPGADADCYAGLAWNEGANMLTWEQVIIVGDNGDPIVKVPDFDRDGVQGSGYPGGERDNPAVDKLPAYDAGDVLEFSTSPMDCRGSYLFTRANLEVIEQSKWCFDLEVVERKAILDLFERPTGRYEWKKDPQVVVKGDCDKGYQITGVPMVGNWFLRLRVYDVCYGDTVIYYPIRAVDKIAPTMVCDDKLVLTLDNTGFGHVSAAQVDEGSNDNCGKVEWMRVRRPVSDDCNPNFVKVKGVVDANNNGKIDPYDPNSKDPQDYVDVNRNRKADPEEYFVIDPKSKLLMTPLMDSIPFFCCDQGSVMVELWGADKAGNRNYCWKSITIEDKVAATCSAPWDITIHCDDKRLAQIDDKVASAKVFGDLIINSGGNCSKLDTNYTVIKRLKCGAGTIERIWTLTKHSDKGDVVTTCKQVIKVLPLREYNICLPKDATSDCKTPIIDTVLVDELACDILAVNVTDKRYDASDDECYKIFRTYTVINWCAYSDECGDPMAEGQVYVVDRANFGNYGKAPIYVLVRDKDRNGDEEFYLSKDLIPNNTGDIPFTPPYCENAFSGNPYGLPVGEYYHSFMYTQIIKVYDSERPVVTGIRDTFCTDPAACAASITKVVTIKDNCTDKVELERQMLMIAPFQTLDAGLMITYSTPRWSVKELGNGQFEIKVANLPEGLHDLIVVGRDECGNLSVATRIPFLVKDCKAPAPICINGLSTELMPDGRGSGMMTVWAKDFVASPIYDCNGQDARSGDPSGRPLITKYSINRVGERPNPNQTSLLLSCADAGKNILVELHAWDEAGNHDFCVTYVEVQDNRKVCAGSATLGEVSGLITTDDLEPVLGVNVDLNGGAQMNQNTGSNGVYLFGNLNKGSDYTVSPQLDKDHINGVSTLDLVQIQKHILGSKAIDSPYRLIAADVNNSRSITTIDMIQIRKLILSIDTKFSSVPSWKFVDASYKFPDPGNPWSAQFPEVVNVNDLEGKVKADFIAIKMGDVNGNASASGAVAVETRSDKAMIISTDEQQLQSGQSYTVVFKAKDLAKIQGYQFTLNIDPELASIEGIDYTGVMKAENFGIFAKNGMITTSFVRAPLAGAPSLAGAVEPVQGQPQGLPLQGDDILFTLKLKAESNTALSEVLALSSRLTSMEAYTQSEEVMGVQLAFSAEAVADRAALRQNVPNPFAEETAIGFYLPKSSKAVLTIRDVKGALVYRIEGNYAKGNNQLILKREQLRASGVLYYTLETSDFVATRKMVLLNR